MIFPIYLFSLWCFQGLSTLLNFDDDFQLLQQASVSLVSNYYAPLIIRLREVAWLSQVNLSTDLPGFKSSFHPSARWFFFGDPEFNSSSSCTGEQVNLTASEQLGFLTCFQFYLQYMFVNLVFLNTTAVLNITTHIF